MSNKIWKFPAGEIGVQLVDLPQNKSETVTVTLKGGASDDILRALMEANAYFEAGYPNVHLYMPYVPYGRQDRVTSEGTSFSLGVFAYLLVGDRFDFEEMTIVDPHSKVTIEMLQDKAYRLRVIEQGDILPFAAEYFPDFFRGPKENTVIVAPDEGAIERAYAAANALGINEVLHAVKERDPATGNVIGLKLQGNVMGKHVIIVDDICDGGRTFIELNKELYGSASQILFVTHGIFSKGYHAVADKYDAVYTTDSLPRREDDGVPSYVVLPLQPIIDKLTA